MESTSASGLEFARKGPDAPLTFPLGPKHGTDSEVGGQLELEGMTSGSAGVTNGPEGGSSSSPAPLTLIGTAVSASMYGGGGGRESAKFEFEFSPEAGRPSSTERRCSDELLRSVGLDLES